MKRSREKIARKHSHTVIRFIECLRGVRKRSCKRKKIGAKKTGTKKRKKKERKKTKSKCLQNGNHGWHIFLSPRVT